MNTICGADCSACMLSEKCAGCAATCGHPFGGSCVAAEYIKAHGKEAYLTFKQELLSEINGVLQHMELPPATVLFELAGTCANLAYPLPNGECVKLLDDRCIYLGCQIEQGGRERCIGVIAGMDFITVCSYLANGGAPSLLLFQKR